MKRTVRSVKKGIRMYRKMDRFQARVLKLFFVLIVAINVIAFIRSLMEWMK